jgi:hypothetical protein
MNIQKRGTTKIINSDFSKIKGKKVVDKTKTLKISKTKGFH